MLTLCPQTDSFIDHSFSAWLSVSDSASNLPLLHSLSPLVCCFSCFCSLFLFSLSPRNLGSTNVRAQIVKQQSEYYATLWWTGRYVQKKSGDGGNKTTLWFITLWVKWMLFKGEELQSSVWVHAFHASVFFLFCFFWCTLASYFDITCAQTEWHCISGRF